jgi:PhzF family phenazine biosynthesis protein
MHNRREKRVLGESEESMSSRRFKQVDVFTTQPFYGNPVAVVLDAEGLDSEQMGLFAAWTNLSETTFVLPPTVEGADYRLRIFTPKGELPFAGHPTIGSAHAILESDIVQPNSSYMVQECGSGLLPLRVEQGAGERLIFVKTPQAKISLIDAPVIDRVDSALGVEPSDCIGHLLVDVGPIWLVVELKDTMDIHALKPDMAGIVELSNDLKISGLTVFTLIGEAPYALYTRSFAPAFNVPEDPVCGSGNASVAAFLAHFDRLGLTGHAYTANQGKEVGRNGVISVRVDSDDLSIEIGGPSVTCIEGLLRVRA